MAEIVRRRSWGGVLPLGRHVSISGSRSIHAPSVSIAPSSFQEEQNARHHKQFKLEQALATLADLELRYEIERDYLEDWSGPAEVKDRLMAELNQCHTANRERLMSCLAELQLEARRLEPV